MNRNVLLAALAVGFCFARAAAALCGGPSPTPRKLTFARQSGDLVGTTWRTWKTVVPFDQDQLFVELTKTGGEDKVSVTTCALLDGHETVIDEFEVPAGDGEVGHIFSRRVGAPATRVKGAILIVKVDGKSLTNTLRYELRLRRVTQGQIPAAHPRSIALHKNGFADMHMHGMAHLAFGGGYVWGKPDEPIHACDGVSHGQLAGFVPVDWLTGYADGHHKDRVTPCVNGNHPCFWPHFADPSHTTVHGTHLKMALDGGLRLIALHAVNSESLCHLASHKTQPCGDMDSVRAQLYAAHAFAARNRWFQIVRDPWEARAAINAGHLAVVLGVEASNLMPASEGKWQDQLDELFDLGVRTMEIVHEADDDFAGFALHHSLFLGALTYLKHPFSNRVDFAHLVNHQGLKPQGAELLHEMAKRHMLIPLDHQSRQSRADTFGVISRELSFYPLIVTHSRFDSIVDKSTLKMKSRYGEYMTPTMSCAS
jgi:microsomal dipeptidase-like Zn-dependent dipeptidase